MNEDRQNQKFSSIHMLALIFQLQIASWRPSGEGTAQATEDPPIKGSFPAWTIPSNLLSSCTLPFKSKCKIAEPSLVKVDTNNPLPSAAQATVWKEVQFFATTLCGAR